MSSVLSVLTTKPALKADLPVDMLLEIAYWCDCNDLHNLVIALNDDRWIENNEIFWKRYFQKIITEDKKYEKFCTETYKLWKDNQTFTNIKICKLIEMLKIILGGKKTESNVTNFRPTHKEVMFQIGRQNHRLLFRSKLTSALVLDEPPNNVGYVNTIELDAASVGELRTIIHYSKHGVFSMKFERSARDIRIISIILIDYINGVRFLDIVPIYMDFMQTLDEPIINDVFVDFYNNNLPLKQIVGLGEHIFDY